MVDTRDGGTPVRAGTVLPVTVVGRGGVPADAVAVVVNVTATEPVAAGHLTVFGCGSGVPATSSLNFSAGETVPAMVTVAVGVGGSICVAASTTAHVVVDVNGAYVIASSNDSTVGCARTGHAGTTARHP